MRVAPESGRAEFIDSVSAVLKKDQTCDSDVCYIETILFVAGTGRTGKYICCIFNVIVLNKAHSGR